MEQQVCAVQEVLFKRSEDRDHADLHVVLEFLETVPALRSAYTSDGWLIQGSAGSCATARPRTSAHWGGSPVFAMTWNA